MSYEAQRLIMKPGDEKGPKRSNMFWVALSFSWCSRCFRYIGSITFTPVVPVVGVKKPAWIMFPSLPETFWKQIDINQRSALIKCKVKAGSVLLIYLPLILNRLN